MPTPRVTPRLALLLAAGLALTAGCTLGPRQIDAGHQRYNQAIKDSFSRELLLNLVRLRYRETPEFVDIGGVAAQYSFDGTARVDAGFLSGLFDLDKLAPGATVNRSERPTITYAPLRGKEFERHLLTPVSVTTIGMLSSKGWSADRILRITTRSMNFLDNAVCAGGPTPAKMEQFEPFLRATSLIRDLQVRHGIEFVLAKREVRTPLPIAAAKVDGPFVLAAFEKGYKVDHDPDGSPVLLVPQLYPALVIHPYSVQSAEAIELTHLLQLEPGRTIYEFDGAPEGRIVAGFGKQFFPDASRSATPAPLPPALPEPTPVPRLRQDIAVQSRSLYEMMYYLSQNVDVPEEHQRKGLVNVTTDEKGCPFDWNRLLGGVFRVRASRFYPLHAYLTVKYRGYWYYVADDDLDTKSTLNLLEELFNIEVRGGGDADNLPVLTLGLGR